MRLLRRSVRKIGWDVHRFTPMVSELARLVSHLQERKVSLVLDVGANVGQYAMQLRDAGYAGRIVSFEPLSEAHAALVKAAGADPLWTVAPRMALGDRAGSARVNVSGNSVSSSLLPMLPAHLAAAPASQYVGTEEIQLATLDSVAPGFVKAGEIVFLKIDAQGFQGQVIAGAQQFLRTAAGVQVEASLTPLYEGELTLCPLVEKLEPLGFELWDLFPGFTDTKTHRLLQCDCIFFRPETQP